MTTTSPDLPKVTWAFHKQLSPAEEREFKRKQTEFKAAYFCTGDPLVLWTALSHASCERQTIPNWLMLPILNTLLEQRADALAERYRERMRHVQRYIVVRDLRRNGHTKDSALDKSVHVLASQGAQCGPPDDRGQLRHGRAQLETQRARERVLLSRRSGRRVPLRSAGAVDGIVACRNRRGSPHGPAALIAPTVEKTIGLTAASPQIVDLTVCPPDRWLNDLVWRLTPNT